MLPQPLQTLGGNASLGYFLPGPVLRVRLGTVFRRIVLDLNFDFDFSKKKKKKKITNAQASSF